jgi:hypothetical protein
MRRAEFGTYAPAAQTIRCMALGCLGIAGTLPPSTGTKPAG